MILIEQNHRSIKGLIRPMLGFRAWDSMESTIAGYGFVNMIKKVSTLMLVRRLFGISFML